MLKVPTSLCDIIRKKDLHYYLDLCSQASYEFLKFESVERELLVEGLNKHLPKIVNVPHTFCIYYGHRNIFELYQGLDQEIVQFLTNVVIKISMNNLGSSQRRLMVQTESEEEDDYETTANDESQYFEGETYVEKCLYQVLSKLIFVQKLELIFIK